MVVVRLAKELQGWVLHLAGPLHERLAWRRHGWNQSSVSVRASSFPSRTAFARVS